jgi:hypothetical protein
MFESKGEEAQLMMELTRDKEGLDGGLLQKASQRVI